MFEVIPSPETGNRDWPTIERKIEIAKSFARVINIDIIGLFGVMHYVSKN